MWGIRVMEKWTYEVQLTNYDARMYKGDDTARYGMTWSLQRSCPGDDGTTYRENIVDSPEVFEDEREALEDALKKLSSPLERPLDYAIRDLLEGF